MSLRTAAAWAGVNEIASLSDVALLKRLRAAADWLGDIAGALPQNACVKSAAPTGRRLRVADGSSISGPGSAGTDWRLHNLRTRARASRIWRSATRAGGESFLRVPLRQGDIVGDRVYARAASLEKVVSAGADLIVRTGWISVRLTTPGGQRVDWNAIYEPMQPDEVCEMNVLVQHSRRKGQGRPPLRARLIVKCKDETATQKAQKAATRGNQRRCSNRLQPMTLIPGGFVMLLTSVPADELTADEVSGPSSCPPAVAKMRARRMSAMACLTPRG